MSLQETFDLICSKTQGKMTGEGNQFKGLCPAHDDHDPSLSVTLVPGDRILLKCWTGCPSAAILGALNMEPRHLFEDSGPERKESSAKPKDKKPKSSAQEPRLREVDRYPYEQPDGKPQFVVIRKEATDRDGKKHKKFSQSGFNPDGSLTWKMEGVKRLPYRLPQLLEAISKGRTVLLTEGEKDCLSAEALGFPATTIPGGAKKTGGERDADTCLVWLKDADVVLVPDNDETGLCWMQMLGTKLGSIAQRVRWLELPDLPPKGDLSDWIIAQGGDAENLQRLINEAPEFEPTQPTNTEPPESSVVSEMYQFSEAGTSRWKETRDGQILIPLANFTARIVEEQLLDDGEVKELHYRIEAERAGEALPEVVVASEQFAKLDFVAKHYGTKAQIFPGIAAKDYLRHAIQVRSGENVPRVSVFTCTGLTEINGQLTYLSGNGALDAENVEVRLDATGQHQLARYQLPASSTPEEKRAGIRASLSFLEVASDVVTIPLWTATYAATIISELEDHFASLFLLGPTGCRKTSLAVSALCHHGLFTTDELFTFNDTTNSLEKAAFTLRDAPMLVDDFYPTTNRRDQDRMVSVFESLTRSAGNRTGRGRMNSDLSLRRSFHPRGMVLFTGEDLIGATSALARLNLVEIEPNDVDLGKLSALQRQHSLLPHALCDFLRWWRDHREQARSLFNNKNLENSLYQTHGSSLHGRLPRQIALWQRMFEVLCLWLIDRDELTQAEAQELHERACQVFVENAQRLQERIQTSTPAQRFLEIVQSLQSSGRLWLKSWSGEGQERPQDAEFFGWRRGDAVYVQGSTVWHLIQGYCQREGSTFPVGQKTLWEHLKRDGVLELQNGKISESSRVPAEDKSQRLIKLRIERLFQSV